MTQKTVVVDQSDLDKALGQIETLTDLLAIQHSKAPSQAVDEMISAIENNIEEIKAEAREYDYILNPRPQPELCGTCNGGPYAEIIDKPCANCGLMLYRARPEDGMAHWVVPQSDNVALPIGEVPT